MREKPTDKFVKHHQHTMFAPKQYNMLAIDKTAHPSGVIECEGMEINVFSIMADLIAQKPHPLVSNQVGDIARIAMHILSQQGKETLVEIIKNSGPSVKYTNAYTDGTLHEFMQCFGAEIIDCSNYLKKLPLHKHEFFREQIQAIADIHKETLTSVELLLHEPATHPQVAIIKIVMLNSMYSIRHLKLLQKNIIAQQNNAKNTSNTPAIGSPQEILARPNYPLAADHACDIAVLLLSSPETNNKPELHKLIDSYSKYRLHSTIDTKATLSQLTKKFSEEIASFSNEITHSNVDDNTGFFDRVILSINVVEGLAEKYPSILHSHSCEANVVDAKIDAVNAFYSIRELRLNLQSMTETQNHKRTPPPGRPLAIHDNGTPPSTNTSSDESHSPTPSYSTSDLTADRLEYKRKCTIM